MRYRVIDAELARATMRAYRIFTRCIYAGPRTITKPAMHLMAVDRRRRMVRTSDMSASAIRS
jgi:hypothetical protein